MTVCLNNSLEGAISKDALIGPDAIVRTVAFIDGQNVAHESRLEDPLLAFSELFQHRGRSEERRGRAQPDGRGITAPGPILRPCRQPRSYGVQCDVPTEGREIAFTLNDLVFETALKNMADAFMSSVPPLRVYAVQAAYCFREIRATRVKRRMVVIRHEAVIPTFDAEFLDDIA